MNTPSEASAELARVVDTRANDAYCRYIEQLRRQECLGWEAKVKAGTFGSATTPPPASQSASLVPNMPGNWPEDAAHENGDYECACCHCGATFYGHKRRVTCKVCASQSSDWPCENESEGPNARCIEPCGYCFGTSPASQSAKSDREILGDPRVGVSFPADGKSQSATPSEVDSRSRLRRIAIEKGEPAPRFDGPDFALIARMLEDYRSLLVDTSGKYARAAVKHQVDALEAADNACEARTVDRTPSDGGKEVDWRAMYRLQTAMRYMDNNAALTTADAYRMADQDVASVERGNGGGA